MACPTCFCSSVEDLTDLSGEVADKVQSLKEGASGYVTKPFELDKLLGCIEKLIGDRSAGTGLHEVGR